VDDLVLPKLTSTLWILGVLVMALVAFHLSLLRWFPLDKLAWKKVDYVWLSLALLGVIGSVISARQEVARALISTAQSQLEASARLVEDRLAFGRGSAVCRVLVRSELSPPAETFSRVQREYDELCSWFRTASERLKETAFRERGILRLEDLGAPPPSGADQWAASSLEDAIPEYNKAVTRLRKPSDAAQRSDIELFLAVVAPFLFAVALALRITKVTGEIRPESSGKRSTS